MSKASFLTHLEGTPCPDCDGTLEREDYKGRDSVVCSDCGTPRAGAIR